jgi:hypothetical protein
MIIALLVLKVAFVLNSFCYASFSVFKVPGNDSSEVSFYLLFKGVARLITDRRTVNGLGFDENSVEVIIS